MPRDGSIRLNYGTRCEHCGFRYLMHETSKDLCCGQGKATRPPFPALTPLPPSIRRLAMEYPQHFAQQSFQYNNVLAFAIIGVDNGDPNAPGFPRPRRSDEHTSELQSLMRTSYAVFCLQKNTTTS